MTLKEAKQVIDEYLAKGETEEDIIAALYLMYQDDELSLDELEKLVGILGYEFTEEFKNMSDEDKKTKGVEFEEESKEIEIIMVNPKEALKISNNKLDFILKMFYNGGHPSLEGNKYIKDYLLGKTNLLPEGIIDEIKKAKKNLLIDNR